MTFKEKEQQAIELLKQAKESREDLAVAWTGGKDSTVMLHLIKRVFGYIPFKVYFNDSTMEFEEIYTFILKMLCEWHFDLIWQKHSLEDLKLFNEGDEKEKLAISRTMKINSLIRAYEDFNLEGFIVGVRWDEHPARAKETPKSLRKGIWRYHPILAFTEKDIWTYIKKYDVPYCPLYDKGYRSLGEKPFTQPARAGKEERDGRERTKEVIMHRLRDLGYW